ncbi:MAG: CBS domain-containing protein [Armatimonadota bacterium]
MMEASEIMTESPATCTPRDSVRAIARTMLENNCGLLPVVDTADTLQLVGVVTDRDIVCRVLAQDMDCETATVDSFMTADKLWTALPNDSIDTVIDRMEEGQVRRIPIVDENNKVLGIISTADIALEIEDEEEIAEVFEEISEPTHMPRE